MRILIALLLLIAALAGCTDSGPEVSTANGGGHVHGNYHTCPDGTKLDPGSFPEHHDPDFDVDTKCPEPGQPAAVSLRLDASQGMAYEPVRMTWDVSPATGNDRTLATEIRVNNASSAPPATPGDYGDIVDRRSSQAVPGTFTTNWVPQAPGTYYLRAYAQFPDGAVWSEEHKLTIAEIPETGNIETITISAAGPLAALTPSSVSLKAGDAIQFQNDDIVDHVFEVSDGPQALTIVVTALSTSEATPLFRLGAYEFADSKAQLAVTIDVSL